MNDNNETNIVYTCIGLDVQYCSFCIFRIKNELDFCLFFTLIVFGLSINTVLEKDLSLSLSQYLTSDSFEVLKRMNR